MADKKVTVSLKLAASNFSSAFKGITKELKKGMASIMPNVGGIKGAFQSIKGNAQNAFNDIRGGLKEFFENINAAEGIGDMSDAFAMLGKSGLKAINSLFAPYTKLIALGVAAFMAVKKLCAQYEELEKVSLRAKFAFSTGGRMGGASFSKYEDLVRGMAADGSVDRASVMEGLGNLRMTTRSIDDKTMQNLVKMLPDLTAFTGMDERSAIEKIGGMYDALSVSYEELRDIGVDVNRQELATINTLKEQGRQREANAIIEKKLQKAIEGAYDAESRTLAGQWQDFQGMLKGMMEDIGQMLAPVLKLAMAIVSPIAKACKFITGLIADMLRPVAALVDGFMRIQQALSKGVGEGFQKISESWKKLWETISNSRIYEWIVKIGEAFASLIGKLVGQLLEMISVVLDKLNEALIGIQDAIVKTAALFGVELDLEKKGEEKKKEDAKKWVDPRLTFSAGFEGLSDMSRRIQTSLIEKNSPQAKMVDLLTKINDGIGAIRDSSREGTAAIRDNVRATENINFGAAY